MSKVIKGADVVTLISVDPAQQSIQTGPNAGQAYYRARHEGKGFIVNEDFFSAFKAGNIAEVSLVESSYQLDDPMNPEQKITRDSWQLSSWATFDQVIAVTKNANKLKMVTKEGEIAMAKLEKEELGKLELTDENVSMLKEALGL